MPKWHVEGEGNKAILHLGGNWLALKTGMCASTDIRRIVELLRACSQVRFDASRLGAWDSGLAAFIQGLEDEVTYLDKHVAFDLSGLPESLRRLLVLERGEPAAPSPDNNPARSAFIERVELLSLRLGSAFRSIEDLVGLIVLSIKPAFTKRLYARAADVRLLLHECGSRALGIVALVSSLIGAILAFVGAVQLRRFGAEIYVANLVGVAVVREMAAVMTAIVMTGRTGGAYAAQIATMQGDEEIDALQALGVPIDQFVIFPRVAALVVMMPLLYFYACFAGFSAAWW